MRSRVAHTLSCMYAPPFCHRRRYILRGGDMGEQCRRHPANLVTCNAPGSEFVRKPRGWNRAGGGRTEGIG